MSTDFAERRAKLDKRNSRKRSHRIHLEVSGAEAVQIAHDYQQVGRCLDWQEPAPRHVNTCQSIHHHHAHSIFPFSALTLLDG